MNQKTYFQKHLLKNAASGFDPRVETHWEDDEGNLNYGKRENWEGQEHIDERQVFPNEVVIDIDAPDTETAEEEARKVQTVLEGEGVPLLMADTGGTGFHFHIFFSYEGLDDWKEYREYRIALFEFLKALCEEEEHGPNTDLWDEGLINFDLSLNPEGHLVRAIGGRKTETERYKSAVSSPRKQDVEEKEEVEFPVKVRHMELAKFSEKQGLFTVQEIKEKVREVEEREEERRKEEFDASELSAEAESLQGLRDLPAHEVLKLIGVDTEPGEMLRCPFHDDKNPSAKVTDGTESGEIPEGVFLCFADSCLEEDDGRSHRYNAIDILTESGRTFREAVQELIQEFDLDAEESDILEQEPSSKGKNSLPESDSDTLVISDGDAEALSDAFPDSEVLEVEDVRWKEEDSENYEKFNRVIVALDSLNPEKWTEFLTFHSYSDIRPELDFLPLQELEDLKELEEELRGEDYLIEKAGEGSRRQKGKAFDLISALHVDSSEVIRDEVASELKELTDRKKSSIEKTLKQKKKELQDSEDDDKDITVDQILQLCDEQYNFLKEGGRKIYAKIGDEHQRIVPIVMKGESASQEFQRNLKNKLKQEYGKIPKNGKIKNAVDLLFDNKVEELDEQQIEPRIARTEDGTIYYDFANGKKEAVKITKDGWEEAETPIFLRNYDHMNPQVNPERNGEHDIHDFTDLLNPALTEEEKMLLEVQIIANFVPGLKHPIMFLTGEPGSGKTLTHRLIRELIDPSSQDSLNLEGNEKEDAIKFYKHYFPIFDNLSRINQETSDLLCKAVTNGNLSKRELYTDLESVNIEFRRPIGLNGLQNLTSNSQFRDLAQRSVVYNLPPIPPAQRRFERDPRKWATSSEELDSSDYEGIRDELQRMKPSLLGYIFDTISEALNEVMEVELEEKHRLSEFLQLGEAISRVLGYEPGRFQEVFMKHSKENEQEAIKNDTLVEVIRALLNEKLENNYEYERFETEEVTATTLMENLRSIAEKENINIRDDFPGSPSALIKAIKDKEEALKKIGIVHEEAGHRKHTIRFESTGYGSGVRNKVKEYIDEETERRDDSVEAQKLKEGIDASEEEIDEAVESLKRKGEIREPRKDRLQVN